MEANNIALSKIICMVPNSQLNLGDLQYVKQAWEALHTYYLPRNSHWVMSLKGTSLLTTVALEQTLYSGSRPWETCTTCSVAWITIACQTTNLLLSLLTTCHKADTGMSSILANVTRSVSMMNMSLPSQSAPPSSSSRYKTSAGFATEIIPKPPPHMPLLPTMKLRREDNTALTRQMAQHSNIHVQTCHAPTSFAGFPKAIASTNA